MIGILVIVGLFVAVSGAKNFFDDSDDSYDGDDKISLDSPRKTSTSTPYPTPTVAPTMTPTMTSDQYDVAFPALPDVREMVVRPGLLMGKKLQITGEINFLRVAPQGRIYELGEEDSKEYETAMYVLVSSPGNSVEGVFIGYNGSTVGMFEGTTVTVYGTFIDTEKGENIFGSEIQRPLVAAELVVVSE